MGMRDELERLWRSGGTLVRLVMVNVGLFALLLLADLVILLTSDSRAEADATFHLGVLKWLAATWVGRDMLMRPWTAITYMFTHRDLLHVLFNMIMLWFAGRIYQDLLGGRRLLGTYLLGGLSGLLLYALSYNFLPFFRHYASGPTIIGASASVMAVLVGIAAYRPQLVVHLILIGPVRLIWVAVVLLLLDLVSIRTGSNSGGHIAHLGGALYGYLAARAMARGQDWSLAVGEAVEKLLAWRPLAKRARMKVAARGRGFRSQDEAFQADKRARQERIDAILDKISRSGYDSLSKDEKDILFRASKDN